MLGEGAGVHGALRDVECTLAPLSEGATLAIATGLALAGKSVIVQLVDAAGLQRAGDALADLASMPSRSAGAFTPTVIVRVPGGTDLRGVPVPVYIAGRESDAAEQIDAAVARGGACVLVDDCSGHAPDAVAPAPLGALVTLREGASVTVVASGSDLPAALAGADGSDAAVLEVRGPCDLGPAIAATGRLVLVGDIADALGGLHAAFWTLEAPWVTLPRGADEAAIQQAIQTVLGA